MRPVVSLISHDICATVRGVVERTSSPYFAAALLHARLAPLRGRLHLLAQRDRPTFEALAGYLGTPTDTDAVVQEVERIAAALLQAMQDPEAARPLTASPQRQLLPVDQPQPLQLPRQQRRVGPTQVAQFPRTPA